MEKEIPDLNAIAIEEGKTFEKKRFIYNKIKNYVSQRTFVGLVGPRGVGKTIILKQLLAETPGAFYISLDASRPSQSLFELAKELADEKNIKLLLLDEIHNHPDFARELKKIFDFLKINVIFTSSAAIYLHEYAADLSRRVRIFKIYPLSFREFVWFEKNEQLEKISIEELTDLTKSKEYYNKTIFAEPLFEHYLKGRNYPFTEKQSNFIQLFSNILKTIVNRDLVLSGKSTPEETIEIEKMLKFIGLSKVEDMSYSTIAKNLGITKYKIEKYSELLERVFVIKRIFPKGSNVLKEPKILFALPYRLLFKSFDEAIGALREDFFTDAVAAQDLEISYLKSERGEKTPDYLVNEIVFEIGGKSKGISQFKGFKANKKIILTHPGKIDETKRPLYFIGMN